MKVKKTKDIQSALTKKGFIAVNSNHIFYFLVVNGKKTSIRTKISHGIKEYSSALLSQVSKQLHLKSSELESLIDCPLTHDKLVELYTKMGLLK